jgi:hypothetical protein
MKISKCKRDGLQMPTPFSYLAGRGYAEGEVRTIIEKYPHINTHAANMSSGHPRHDAITITDSMMVEFEGIFNKILDGVKKDMKGSPEMTESRRDNIGNVYSNSIDYRYYTGIRAEQHGGYPGCQYMWEQTLAGQVCKKIEVLSALCGSASQWLKEKEAADKKLAELHALLKKYSPILKKSLVFGKCNRSVQVGTGEVLRKVGKYYILFKFDETVLVEVKKNMTAESLKYVLTHTIVECDDKIDTFCKREEEKQYVDAEVERRLERQLFENRVSAELRRREAPPVMESSEESEAEDPAI